MDIDNLRRTDKTMTQTTRNLGGRPEIGGKIGPVSYGPDLLAAIDRTWPADNAASRSDWLRDQIAATLNRRATEDITWADMTAAGIDTDLVDRRRDDSDPDAPMWQATSPSGGTRIVFGVAADPDNVVPDGEHKGWDAAIYDLVTEPGDDHPTEYHGSSAYFEGYDLPGLLALVATIAPLKN